MSYCRFSSDNWESDVYVYASQWGYECHVASNRLTADIPPLFVWDEVSQDEWFTRYTEHIEAVRLSERVPIGGTYDGQSFTYDTLEELREGLRGIQGAGYHVPEYVFERIEEEQTDDRR